MSWPNDAALRDGDHRFKTYAWRAGVPDCHFKIADANLDGLTECLPDRVSDVARVLVGGGCFSLECGALTRET